MADSARLPKATAYKPKKVSGPSFELPKFSFGTESLSAGTNIPPPPREPTPPPPETKAKEGEKNKNSQGSSRVVSDPLRSHPTSSEEGVAAGNDGAKGTAITTVNGNAIVGTTNGQAQQHAASQSMSFSSPPQQSTHRRKFLSLRSLSSSFSSKQDDSTMAGSDFGPPVSRSKTPSIFGRRRRESSSTGARPTTPGGMSVADSFMTGAEGRPSLRKRVSGVFWKRRNSLTLDNMVVDEAPEESLEVGHTPGAAAAAPTTTTTIRGGRAARGSRASNSMVPAKRKTPPPQLPEIGKLKLSKGLAEDKDSGFLGGEDMFSNITYKREVSAEEVAMMKRRIQARRVMEE